MRRNADEKAILLGLVLFGLLSLAGCKKEQGQEQPGVQQGEQQREVCEMTVRYRRRNACTVPLT